MSDNMFEDYVNSVDADKREINKIHINGVQVELFLETIGYQQIVELAFPERKFVDGYTVVYQKGPIEKPEGFLYFGQWVDVVDGMVIDAAMTGDA